MERSNIFLNSCSYQIHSRRYLQKSISMGIYKKELYESEKVLGIIMGIFGIILVIIEILLKMEESMSISVIGGR